MNWDDLATFLAVYRHGTYAAAGRALGVNATTVVRRLERLSDSLGAVLFQASSDGLIATAAAEAIHPSAVAMERQATLIERRMSGDEARLSGKVLLTTSAEFVTYFLVDHLPALRERHPRLELELVISDRYVTLTSGEADIALRFSGSAQMPLTPGEPPDGVVGRLLGPTAIAVVASKDYLDRRGRPGPDVNLDGHDLILPPGVSNLPGMRYLQEKGKNAHVAFRVGSLAALAEAASRGLGITATPWFMVNQFTNLEVISPDVDARSAWLMMPKDLRRVARVRAVRDFLVELFVRWGGFFAGDELAVPVDG